MFEITRLVCVLGQSSAIWVMLWLCCLRSEIVVAQAPDGRTGAITTAVPFLLINPDSRGGAMGDAGVAVSENANAIFWNPANLAFSEKRYGFCLNYTPWLRALNIPDINLAYVPFYFRVSERGGTFGAALRYFSLGSIQFTDAAGNNIGLFEANEFSLEACYTRKVTENFSAGVNLKYIHSNLTGTSTVGGLPTNPARSFAGDMSFLYNKNFEYRSEGVTLPLNLRIGANISNIGAKIAYTEGTRRDFIPTNLRLGWALKAEIDEFNSFTVSNDFNKLMVPSRGGAADIPLLSGIFNSFTDTSLKVELKEFNVGVGAEYWYKDVFAARAGWFWEDPNKGARNFLTLGAGLHFKSFSVDFSYLAPFRQNHPLQNTLRFTLSFDFD